MISISSDFDHGNIICIDADSPADIQLKIKPDGAANFFQWFLLPGRRSGGSAA